MLTLRNGAVVWLLINAKCKTDQNLQRMKDALFIAPVVTKFRFKFKTKGTEKPRHARSRVEYKIT